MIIYKTTNLINGKIYVGQDTHNNPKYLGSGILIERAIRKYGESNFKKETLETCDSQDELDKKEVFWITELRSYNKRIGYNISHGGQGGNLCKYCSYKLKGENYYLNKMSKKERERHLNTFRRGMNYWISKGFTTVEEIEKWIKDNWCAENHSHRKGKTEEEYKKWRNSTDIGINLWPRNMTIEERNEFIQKNLKGKNNPIFRNKTEKEIEEWLNNNRRGKNAPNAKYYYTITTNTGIVVETDCLKSLCKEKKWNLHILLKFIEVSGGKRKQFVPRIKEYVGWKVTKKTKNPV